MPCRPRQAPVRPYAVARWRRGEVAGQLAHHLGIDTGARRRSPRVGTSAPMRRSASTPVDCCSIATRSSRPSANTTCSSDSSSHASESGRTGDVLVSARGLGAPRVDHHHPAAASVIADSSCLIRGARTALPCETSGLAPEHQQEVGAGQVGERHLGGGAVQQLAGHEPAVDVLGAGRVLVHRTEPLQEHARSTAPAE